MILYFILFNFLSGTSWLYSIFFLKIQNDRHFYILRLVCAYIFLLILSSFKLFLKIWANCDVPNLFYFRFSRLTLLILNKGFVLVLLYRICCLSLSLFDNWSCFLYFVIKVYILVLGYLLLRHF